MPKLPPDRDPEVEAALAEIEAFDSPTAWRKSKRGNLWREWENKTVTIFGRDDGQWGWCIHGAEGPRYSRVGFDEIADAMSELSGALGVGQ